jgi:hypothetical protein
MGLYRLQESNNLDTETLVEFFLSEETTAELERQVEYDEQKLVAYTKSLEDNEKELKKLIESKPRSWLERKLISFHKAIKRFEAKYVYAKDGKTKGIIGKILSILTRIVKFINDKLLKLTKYVGNKFFNRQEKLKDHHNKILDKKEENRMHRLDIDSTKKSLEINKNRLVDNKKSDSETSKLFDTNISKEERQKIMDKLKAKMDKESKQITDNMLRNK